MTLVIEDGSQIADANSYAAVADLRAYAQLRGITTLPVADADCEPLMIRAMDYIEGLGGKFKGVRTAEAEFLCLNPSWGHRAVPQTTDQPLQWPRRDVWIDSRLFPDNAIPREIFYAQLALACEASGDGTTQTDLQPTRLPTDPGPIVGEKVGSLELRYNAAGANARVLAVAAFAKADALLRPLLKANGLFLVRA